MESMDVDWDVVTEIANTCGADHRITSKVITLLNSGNTLPFIARYRREATGNLNPDVLRAIKAKLSQCREVIEKVNSAYTQLSARGLMTDELRSNLRRCKTTSDVTFIESVPKTLASKARSAGLEPLALAIFRKGEKVDFSNANSKLSTMEVKTGVLHIMSEWICKDIAVLQEVESLCFKIPPNLETSKIVQKQPTPNVSKHNTLRDMAIYRPYFNFSMPFNHIPPHKILAINRGEDRKILRVKLSFSDRLVSRIRAIVGRYFLHHIHPTHHNLLWWAFDDGWKRLMKPCLTRKLRSRMTSDAQETSLLVFGANLRRILMTAPLRNAPLPSAGDLNAKMIDPKDEVPAPDVVSSSLGAPGDRLPVVGLDPGFRHGTKWAACDPLGVVIATGILHVTVRKPEQICNQTDSRVQALVTTMISHGISTIALGNGTACRETEKWLTNAIKSGLFSPLPVRYAIVNECGASTYSVSPLACQELPELDVSLRGAVSIARRLQDPLAEMVKIEPQHLGVGMYQHDLPPRKLQAEVEEALEECISFVGVDVNTAQKHVLARVAGLSQSKALEIINYRIKHGRFRCRNEILKVRGIGANTFAQCAGFLRVKPEFSITRMDASKDVEFISLCSDEEVGKSDDVDMKVISLGRKRNRLVAMDTQSPTKRSRIIIPEPNPNDFSFNPLDQTAIHPASYHIATALIRHLNYEVCDIGSTVLRNSAKALFASKDRDTVLSLFTTEEFGLETLCDILDALCRPLDFDERQDLFTPMFRSSVISITNLSPGLEVQGCVRNVTTFGAFVDIGVEVEALIPINQFPRPSSNRRNAGSSSSQIGCTRSILQQSGLRLGDRIKAKISSSLHLHISVELRS
ncbi:unnamed protein product [Rodentolepis nana]|uniref:S1 motif domain-containing protein n=1 Tax=Rodentolepis nana TaxID=102285 RepID=A0A158QHF9_RODNA|nr:unnamed protein product [Rodentolepis nana]